jgi:glycosyltransferase involved in cell wall biosynthesis
MGLDRDMAICAPPVPAVSVIIPCFNNEGTLERAVRSALDQTGAVTEVIVVCDGSTDTSPVIARELEAKHPGRVIAILTPNGGPSRARNVGIERARAAYLLFLDADDSLTPDGIDSLLKRAIATNSDMAVGLAIGDHGHSQELQDPKRLRGSSDLERLVRDWWAISAVLVRKGTLRWQEGMNAWEVVDFFARHLLSGHSVTYCETYVTVISYTPNPNRVTDVYNHYEPVRMASFFSDLKSQARASGKLDSGVASAADFQILSALVAAYGARADVSRIRSRLFCNPRQFPRYGWYRPFGASGFCSVLGLDWGLRLFCGLGRLAGKWPGPVQRQNA